MKHCVRYPDDKFLAVRPCLVAICLGNRPAAKLLGALLYRYNLRVENKEDAENQNAVKAAKGEKPDQDTTYRIFRKQAQLVEDMCGEMTEKTLHDVAVPMLQLLGFIDLEEHMSSNCYIVDVDRVQQALNMSQDEKQLETFLISTIQLETFLITPDELEMFLIDKKYFLSGLEKVLIYNRNVSNHKRGRKVAPDAVSRRVLRRTQNLKEITKKDKEEKGTFTQSATAIASHAKPAHEDEEDDGRDDTGKRDTDTDSSQQHAPVPAVPGMDAGAQHQSDPAGGSEKPTQGKRTRTSKTVKNNQPVLLSEPKEVQRRIDAQRGYELEEGVDIIRERKAIKAWCAKHPIADYDTVMDELVNRDRYWSKPENKCRIGGLTLLKETPKVLARLRLTIVPAPEERETIVIEDEEMTIAEAKRRGLYSDFDVYVGNGYEERKRFIEEGERLLAAGLLPTDEELGWVPVGAGKAGVS